MENFVASSATDEGNPFFVTNPTSAPSLKVVSLADYNPYGTPAANYNDRGNLNPSLAIPIVGLFSFIFLIMIFSVCICNGLNVGEGSRDLPRPGANNNVRGTATGGLEQTVIERFPVISYSLVKGLKSQAKGSECAVCLSDFVDDEMVRLLPKCSHAFHPECIDMWLCSHTTCPVCRISLTPAEGSTPTATGEPRTTPEQVMIVVDNGNIEAPETSNDSTVMVQPREWCIPTRRGLTPGLQWSSSFEANHRSQAASTSNAPPWSSKTGSFVDNGRRRSKSERWGIGSNNPTSFLRSLSERVVAPMGEQGGMEQTTRKAYLRRTFSWLLGRERERNRAQGLENRSVSFRHDQVVV